MKKTAIFSLVLVSILGLGVLAIKPTFADEETTNTARAFRGHGGPQRGLEIHAEFFGMSEEELEAALENKTMLEIAEDQGKTTEDWFSFMKEKMVERMTENGLSDDEINERISDMETRHAERVAEGLEGDGFGPFGGPGMGSRDGKGEGRGPGGRTCLQWADETETE